MRIFIPGGAGYVGSCLVPKFLAEGFKVTVLDNFMYGQPSLSRFCRNRNFEIIVGDVRDKLLIKKLLSNADIIIPLAAIVGAPACSIKNKLSYETNVESIRILRNFLDKNQLVIFPSTNSVYGVGQPGRPCNESSDPNPISEYAKQKLEGEKIIFDHPYSICTRFATLFGISDRMRLDLLVNNFVWQAVFRRKISLFEGNFKRNFLHVLDAAEILYFLAQNPRGAVGELYNCGLSNVNLNKLELCELIKKFVIELKIEENLNTQDPDQRNYIVSNEKIEKLGVKGRISLEDGIQELIRGMPMYENGKYSNV